MPAIGALYPTLSDITKRLDPSGSIAPTAELLEKKNPILQDIAFVEGNLLTGHRYNSRTALPSLTWRKFNQGTASSKSQTDAAEETCGMLTGMSYVDCDLAALGGNAAAFRASEDNAFISAFGIEVATGLFYYSTAAAPERMNGLTPRFNSTAASNPAAAQIIKADSGASGADQTSIWLIGHSPDTVFGIYPKGTMAGLKSEDLGKQLVRDGSSNAYTAWTTKWVWNLGLCVRDYRYVVRIANIDTSAWRADLSGGADLVLSMMDAIAAMYDTTSVQPVFYMNRATFSMFNKQLVKKGTANLLEWIDRGGNRIASFMGIPIRVVDALTNTESVVS